MAEIGRLEKLPIRQLWKHEERGFSRWLEENAEILEELLGFSVEILEREKWVGSFKVDLVGQNPSGDLIIVENQLEPSNHDHLGKLITYATNLEAKGAIWIVTEARPEHVAAVNWLNEATPADMAFFMLKLDGYRIDESRPAPLLTLVVGPTPDTKAIGQEKKELAQRHLLRLKFWERLLETAKSKGLMLHANRSPGKENWISAGAGKAGLSWNYVVWMDGKSAVELYIDTGDVERNKSIFSQLETDRESVEDKFGSPLSWERLDERRACRIRFELQGGLLPEEEWPQLQDQLVEAMGRLSSALGPGLARLS